MSATARAALVVYLMGTQIAEDLTHLAHTNEASTALEGIDPRGYGLTPARAGTLRTDVADTVIPSLRSAWGG